MREPERFREHLADNPALFAPDERQSSEDLLERCLLIGDLDGNECVLYIRSSRQDDWAVVLWDPEQGFWDAPSLEDLFVSKL